MVDKSTAAALCNMTAATYDKYAKRNLLPPMNVTGRISVEALKSACLKLDGMLGKISSNDPDEALAAWERENGRHEIEGR